MKGCGNKLPSHIRRRIRTNYLGICQTCEIMASIQIHHIIKLNDVGQGVFKNGILLCEECLIKVHRNPGFLFEWRELSFEGLQVNVG